MGRSVWRPQIEALADRYRCISVDQPGHGTLQGREVHARRRGRERHRRRSTSEAGGRAVARRAVARRLRRDDRRRPPSREGPRPRHRRLHARAAGLSRLGFLLYSLGPPARPGAGGSGRRAGVVPAPLRARSWQRRSPPAATSRRAARGPSGTSPAAGSGTGCSPTAARSSSSTAPMDLVFRIGAGRFLAGRPGRHEPDDPARRPPLERRQAGGVHRPRRGVHRDASGTEVRGPARQGGRRRAGAILARGPLPLRPRPSVRFDARPKGCVPGCRLGHPLPPGDEGTAQGDAAARRQADHPVRVEEAVAAGIEQIIIVTSSHKRRDRGPLRPVPTSSSACSRRRARSRSSARSGGSATSPSSPTSARRSSSASATRS